MRKKVLFLIYQLAGGGAEKVMVDIVNHMDQSIYDITILTIIDCSEEARNILSKGIKYDYLFKGKYKEDRLFFRLFYMFSPEILHKAFIRKKFDVKIAALEGIPSKIISGCKDSAIKKIAIIHADASNMAWPSGRYKNFHQENGSYNRFDHLIFVSKNTKKSFVDKFQIQINKTLVLYNPFDFEIIKKRSLEPVEDFKKNSKFLFCAIGRLEKVKGFERLITAFYKVQKNFKDIELIIIGNGKEYGNISKLINSYDLNEKVKLLGYCSNPYKYLRRSDCYICSSWSEGLSSTVIEAMILEKPVVATDCGGMDELLRNYSNGIVVNNNISGLINGIEQFLKKSRENKIVNESYEETVLEKFTYEYYFGEMTKIM